MEIYRVALIGHRRLEDSRTMEMALEDLVCRILDAHEYVEFFLGRNGDFDLLAASVIKRVRRELGRNNGSLILVLPYHVKDEEYFEAYYDEILMPLPPKIHYKNTISQRNRWMVEQADLLVCYVQRDKGGAYTAWKHAKKLKKQAVNLAEKEQTE